MIAWLCLGWLAATASDQLLAPTIEDLDRSTARAERLLGQAELAHTRLAEAHAGWVEARCGVFACAATVGVPLATTSRAAGHDTRDLLQGARAELRRSRTMAAFEAVRPLVDERRRAELVSLEAQAEVLVRSWLARATWQQRHVEPWARVHATLMERACAEPEPVP